MGMHVVGAEAGGGVAAAVFVLIQNISQIHCILELSFKMSTALFGGELVCRFRLQSVVVVVVLLCTLRGNGRSPDTSSLLWLDTITSKPPGLLWPA